MTNSILSFVNIIKEIAREVYSDKGTVVACKVISINSDYSVNGCIFPDTVHTIPNIPNPNNFYCEEGDIVLLYKIDNKLNNSFILSNKTRNDIRIRVSEVGKIIPTSGPTGNMGAVGFKGPTGSKGESGDKGSTGLKGESGDKGSTGLKGESGDKGSTGLKGESGDKGSTGSKGESGDKGSTGSKGESGDKGSTGSKGEKGPTGSFTGATGSTGAEGPQGPQGKPGQSSELKLQDGYVILFDPETELSEDVCAKIIAAFKKGNHCVLRNINNVSQLFTVDMFTVIDEEWNNIEIVANSIEYIQDEEAYRVDSNGRLIAFNPKYKIQVKYAGTRQSHVLEKKYWSVNSFYLPLANETINGIDSSFSGNFTENQFNILEEIIKKFNYIYITVENAKKEYKMGKFCNRGQILYNGVFSIIFLSYDTDFERAAVIVERTETGYKWQYDGQYIK